MIVNSRFIYIKQQLGKTTCRIGTLTEKETWWAQWHFCFKVIVIESRYWVYITKNIVHLHQYFMQCIWWKILKWYHPHDNFVIFWLKKNYHYKIASILQAIFDSYFLTKKCIFSLSFTQFHWICFQGYNWKYVVIGSGNGMVPNRRQAITWANDVMIHKLICVLVGLIETTHFGKSFWTNTSEHNFIAFKVLKGVYVIYLNIFIYIHMFFFAGNHLSIVIHWLTFALCLHYKLFEWKMNAVMKNRICYHVENKC